MLMTCPKNCVRGYPGIRFPLFCWGGSPLRNFTREKVLVPYLFTDALKRISQASQAMAVYAVVVDALNDRAAGFYQWA